MQFKKGAKFSIDDEYLASENVLQSNFAYLTISWNRKIEFPPYICQRNAVLDFKRCNNHINKSTFEMIMSFPTFFRICLDEIQVDQRTFLETLAKKPVFIIDNTVVLPNR